MASTHTGADYLFNLLTTRKATKINSSVFIAADPTKTELPANINPEALKLLKNINGRIFPIALRGKCQAGKSTTLNRIAKLSNIHVEQLLEVAEGFGGSTTEGVWLMAITFDNKDTLLLFDVQGTDRGADEITHKLIAFTDHICTKVVDVFRMPLEGFSNEYINSLYCLAMARHSVQNLRATSHKAILWTNCVLPKRSPLKSKTLCNTPSEYQTELLNSSVGERAVQGAKAKSYAQDSPILTTNKPSDDILFDICQLENNHPFIENEIIPVLKTTLNNVQPVMVSSHVINDGQSFVEYLNNVYSNIKASFIDLPFCALPMIRSIAMVVLKEKKSSAVGQIDQVVSNNLNDMNQILNILMPKLKDIRNQIVIEFKEALSDLSEGHWQDQLNDVVEFINNKIREIVDRFKPKVLEYFLVQNYLNLNRFCEAGSSIIQLRTNLEGEIAEILQKMENISFLQENISKLERDYIEKSLNKHQLDLYRVQEIVESDWQRRLNNFEQKIYSTDPEGVDQVINQMIREHKEHSQRQFLTFNIRWRPFYDENTMIRVLKEDNIRRSNTCATKCQDQCIGEFNRQVGIIVALNTDIPAKYGKLIKELEICLRKYYDKLPWPLNDQTIGAVDDRLKGIFNQVMGNLYTPEVRERLKRDRIEQMATMSRLSLADNESLLWVYCVGCQRIFAGRTRGCVNVTCCHFSTNSGGTNVDHGCGLTFEWAKAQPVPIENLSPDIWFSNIETDQRGISIRNLFTDAKETIRSTYSAGPRLRSRSVGN